MKQLPIDVGDMIIVVNTDSFNDMIANPGSVIYPLPADSTLELLQSYGVPYPGNAVIPSPIELIRLADTNAVITQQDLIMNFLTEVYPKARPNSFANIAIGFTNYVTNNPNILSVIYSFYTVTGNQSTDIIPPESALPLNADITDLEKTYHQYCLDFIMGLFTNHVNDTIDNPHQDQSSNLVNVWIDFFQTLYNQYIALSSNPISLDAFIIAKTTSLDAVATTDDYVDPLSALFIVPIVVIQALINDHNVATDSSIHPNLQADFFVDTNLPFPIMSIIPEIFSFRGQKLASGTGYYYTPVFTADAFPRMNSSLYVQAQINMASSTTINVLSLSSSLTTDTLNILKLGSSTNSYQINLNINGTNYQNIIPLTNGTIVFVLAYTTTGITISYINDSGTTVVITQTITSLVLDFDTLTIGVQCAYPTAALVNTIQKIMAYPTVLSSGQISLLFQTIIS